MSRLRVTAVSAVISIAFVMPAAAQSDDALVKRGAYLVNGPVACSNCHGTRNPDFSIADGMEFAGRLSHRGSGLRRLRGEHYARQGDGYRRLDRRADHQGDPRGRRSGRGHHLSANAVTDLQQHVRRRRESGRGISSYAQARASRSRGIALEYSATGDAARQGRAGTRDVGHGGIWRLYRECACALLRVPHADGPDRPGHVEDGRRRAGDNARARDERCTRRTSRPIRRPVSATGATRTSSRRSPRASPPQGRHVSPPMPFPWFNNMTAEDLDAVVAYLHTRFRPFRTRSNGPNSR